MKSYIPRSSRSNLRVFNACLLSFLLVMMPLATLAASMRSMTAPDAVKASEPEAAPAQAQSAVKAEPQPASATGFFNFLAPPVASPVTANLTDNITPNTTKVDKGSTITYTATITNTSGGTINGVEFQDTPDSNTTLVPGSIHASPVANDDTYNWVGNTVLDTSARGLPTILANDTAPTDSFTLNTTPTVAPAHGSVTISSNGHFVYTPAAGYSGDDTFQYTIANSTDATLTSTGTVTIHMPFRVWYVQNAASNGDGRNNSPFNSPSSVSTAANASTDIIYIFSDIGANAKLNGNFALDNSQILLGQGVALVVNPNGAGNITLFSANTAPTITDSSGNGVTLAQNNTLAGFIVGDTSAIDIANTTTSSVGTLNISSVTLNGTGGLFRADAGGTLSVTFDAASTTSAPGNAIQMNNVTGTFTVNGSGAISGVTGTGVLVSGGNATVSIASSINKSSSGRLVDIQSRTANNVTLSGQLDCSSSCTGINVSSNTGGTIDFSNGTKNISTGTNQAVTLATNTGTTINFSNGGLNIDTTSGDGFDASGGGTINITTGTNNNTIDSTTGTPFSAANVTLGAGGVTFKSISANGGNHGIVLTSTSGNFTVTGDGTGHANGSGGTIQNITGNVIGDNPVWLTTVNGTITLKSINMSILVTAYSGMHVDNNAGGTATVNVTGCSFSGVQAGNSTQQKALLQFETGGAANLTANVQNSFFYDNRTYGVATVAAGTSIMNVTVNQSGFGTDIPASGVATNNPGTTITNPPPFSLLVSNSSGSQVDYTISNNTFWGGDGAKGAIYAVAISGSGSTATAHLNGTITGNKLGKSGVTGSGCKNGCAGFGLLPGPGGNFTATVTNNDIRQINSDGGIAYVNTVGAGVTTNGKVKIKGNTLAEPDTTGSPAFLRAIVVSPGNSGGANDPTCAEVGDVFGNNAADKNTITGAWTTTIRMTNNNNSSVLTAPGLSPTTGATAAQVQTYLEAHNTVTAGTTLASVGTAGIDGSASSCFLLLALGGVSSSGELFGSISDFDLSQALTADQTTVASLDSFSLAKGEASARSVAADSAASPNSSVTASLSQQQLDAVVAAAIQRWTATGLTAQQLETLRAIKFEISDLSNAYLGEADSNRVLIDRDAEGRGWFVDPNPLSDESFAHAVSATLLYTDATSAPAGHVDLLTAIEHEMGHHLKLADIYSATERDNLMYGYLTVGERRLPAPGQAQSASNNNKLSKPHFLTLANASEPLKNAEKIVGSKSATNAVRNHSAKGRALNNAAILPPVGPPVDVIFGTLTAGKVVQVKFQVTVNNSLSPANTTSVQTQGTVKVSTFLDTPTNDPDTVTAGDATVTLISRKDLALTSVSDGVTTINPGQTLTYTITYSNPGHAATGVFITETVPTGTTYDSVTTPGWTCTPNNNAGSSCTKNIGSLAAGAGNATTTFAVTVNSPAASHLNTISDTATIDDDHAYEADFDTSNNSATDNNTTLNAQPAFGTFTKSDGVTTTTPGSTLTYTITYANTGNQDAEGVFITDTLPPGTTFNSGASTVGWTETPSGSGSYKLTIGNVAAGASSATATFVVTVNNPVAAGLANIVNNASITDDGTNSASAITANASDTDTLNAAPDLAISKTPDVANASADTVITYTLNYSNGGNQGATGVVVTETVPANTKFVAAGSSTWTGCADGAAAGTVCTNTVGAVAGGGAGGSLTFKVKVVNPVPGGTTQITNTATIDDDHANGPDPNNANNTTGNVNTPVCQSSVTVTNTNDSGAGSLRQAIADACPGATIDFNIAGAGPHTITLSTGQLVVDKNLTIQNTSGKVIIVSGGGASRVFYINSGITATIDNLTITNGLVSGASPGGAGGAIYNDHGTLTIKNSTVSGSTANPGAGIFNDGSASGSASLTIINSTISGNTSNADGGAVYNQGVSSGNATLSITNSTISGNTAKFSGGGVVSDGTSGSASVTITNSTITNNRADSDTNTVGEGGGLAILGGSTVILRNSIVALNFKGGSPSTTANDIFNALDAVNSTHNLVGNCNSCGLTNGTNNNTLGVTSAQLNIGPLQNNGGNVQTHALLSGSIAIDAGNNAYVVAPPFLNTSPITDERGTNFPRIADSADADTTATVDIGAYEAHPTVEDITDKATNEDTPLAFSFNIGDGTGALIQSVAATSNNTNIVTNANLVITGSGSSRTLTITPQANANTPLNGTATITVTVTATNGQTATDTFVLTVNPVADTPSVTNASTFVNLQTSSGLVISRNAADGAEIGFFKITNIQNGTLFKNDGTTQINSGDFITFAEGNAGLKFTPTTDSTTSGSFDVQGSVDNAGAGLSSGTATATITVSKSGTTTSVTSSSNPSFTNQNVTFTATVTSNTTYSGPPTGNVDFFDNGSPTPITGCSAKTLDGSGVATCQTNALSVGNHTITATYNGDAAFNSSTGNLNTNPQVVNPSLSLTVNDTADTHDNNIGDGLCADLNGKCTLRAALEETNAIPSGDIINFDTAAGHAFDPATAPHTITLDDTNGALPAIDGDLTITGPGANQLTVKRSNSASSEFRIFAINSGKTASISGLTMSGGKVSAAGGGILNNGTLTLTDAVVSGNDISSGSSWGGGIFNGGTLTMTDTTVSGNTSGSGGSSSGGGIFNSGVLTVTNSTVSGNSAGTTGPGGGIYNTSGTLTLVNSTVSGNTAQTDGGGIYNGSGTATLTNVTVTNNRANNANLAGTGGGINVSGGTLTLHNTIVFGNFKGSSPSTTADDIAGTVDAASSFNLIGTGGAGGLTNGTNNNQVNVADARLDVLANNGGPTKTHALLSGSPALDAGDNAVTGPPLNLLSDQRGSGYQRQVDGPDADTTATVDIGAFEAQLSLENIPDQSTNEDTQLQFNFSASSNLTSSDITVTSSNTTIVPNANISVTGANSPFTLTINPAADQNTFASGPITITVTATIGPNTTTDTFLLTVAPVADTPSVANITTLEDTQSGAILVSKNAADGAEVTHFKVTGITNGTLFLNDGVTQINNNDFVPFSSVGAGLKFTPAANLNSPGSAFGFTIQAATGNVDAALGGGTATSTITVTAVNDAPSFTKGADQTVNEDSGAQTVNNWATAISPGPADESGQTVNFIVTNDNNALFSAQPAVSSTGTLTYTPAANANGMATVSVSLHDNGGGTDTSAVQTFTITVTAVNDTPSFTKGADQTVFANSGAQTVNGWATAISAGPANESSQVVDFIVTNNNNGLFSTQPAVAANGTLTYTPATNQSGTALVTVQIHDNGGGADTSAPQTFNITVNKSGTTTALVSSVNPSFTGQTVTFTATVTSNTPVTGPPTGTVQFFDGVNPLTCSNGNTSTETLDGTGKATCQTSALSSAGSPHSISAVYSGDGAYSGSTSNTVSQTVKPVLNLTVNDTGDTSDANPNDGLCADSNGKCTLRAAIEQTNFAASDDTIGFSLPANSTITLLTALPAIDGNLVINGTGANTLTVKRSTAGGTPDFDIFTINNGKVVTISGLTISNGRTNNGGGILNDGGVLTVNNSTISGNFASGPGGGILNRAPLSGTATLTVTNSTINGNSVASFSGGGGITNLALGNGIANAAVTNSTISGNSTGSNGGGGGGIYILASTNGTSTVTVTNSTITANTSGSGGGGGGIDIDTSAGGTVAAKLSNTIVAGNFKDVGTTPSDIRGTADPTSSFNLIGTGGSGGLTNAVNNNQVGVTNARLAPLANNGGTTQTHALLPGSPALDAGSNTIATNAGLTTDQRGTGFNRSVDSPDADTTATTDIGAFEAQPSIEDITDKSTNEDTALPTFNFNVADGGVSGFTVTATSSNTTLVPNANINIGGAGQTRTLSITPAANEFGTTTISVTVSGTVGATNVSMTDTFVLTVNSVNDAPTFTPGSNQTVNEDAGAQSVQWATNVSAGPANESGQTVAFTVTNNNNALFSVQPSISPTGVLTYTPATNAGGTATVSVTLMDNGGTANGGSDTSATVQFTITVNAVNDAPVNSVPGPQSTARNTDLTFSTANGNLISISDVDAGANQVKVTLAATNGKLTLSGTTGLTFTPANSSNDGVNDATLVFTGTITNINNALSGLVFSPTPGFDGAASIQITTDDQGNSGSGGPQTDTDTISITVNKGGVLAFSSATYSVSEAGGSITITVNRIGGSSGTTKVDYATSNGTATAGADYTAASGTLTFGNGETTKTFNVPILEDSLNEANETVNLTLSNAQGSGDLGTPSTAVLTINDNDPQPSLSINDVSKNEGNSGTTSFTFTVTLSAVSGQSVTVDYSTADGTATAPSDYQAQSNTLTFAPGETTKTITVLVNGDTAAEPDETFFVNLSGAVHATISDNQGLGTILSDDTPLMQFSAASYTVAENGQHATITVNRLGDLSKAATVDYATTDPSGLTPCSQVTGNASQRCDYATSVGTLRFAAGESSKTIFIPIVNDVYVEGPESFTITLSNSTNADLGSITTSTVNITDDDNGGAGNPIVDDAFFIRQLYIDFLGREPEPAGLQGWLDFLHNTSGQCKIPTDCDRIAVALGFIRSPEFQDRGYFAFRFYAATLERNPSYSEFIPDIARLSGFLNPAELEANKNDFVNQFMNRQEFKLKYDPTIGDPTSYVDKLLQSAGLPNHPLRNGWISALSNNTMTRAQVLRQFIESTEVYTKFYNQAIIVMNYFGFLRRDPDAAYQAWIDIFNHTNDYRVITNGFINSPEYPLRVGP